MVVNGIYLPFNGTNANIPANWEEGTQFAGRIPFGAATDADGGTDGGNATHTHNHSSHTHTFAASGAVSPTVLIDIVFRGIPTENSTHAHFSKNSNASTTASGTADNEPPNWEVIFITPSGAGQDVPAGTIGLFDDTLPAGWTNAAALNNSFLKGVASGGDAGDGGGSSEAHTHTTAHIHSNTTSNATTGKTSGASGTPSASSAGDNHTHLVSFASSSSSINNGDATPTYRDLIAATAAADGTPIGLIGIWDSTVALIPSGWERVTLQDGKFLRVDSTVGTGGSDQHTHTSAGTHTHTATDANGAFIQVSRATPAVPVANYNHNHNWTVGTSSPTLANNTAESNYPLYRTAIFIKYVGAVVSAFKPYIQSY